MKKKLPLSCSIDQLLRNLKTKKQIKKEKVCEKKIGKREKVGNEFHSLVNVHTKMKKRGPFNQSFFLPQFLFFI